VAAVGGADAAAVLLLRRITVVMAERVLLGTSAVLSGTAGFPEAILGLPGVSCGAAMGLMGSGVPPVLAVGPLVPLLVAAGRLPGWKLLDAQGFARVATGFVFVEGVPGPLPS